jgi:hypothetical protein
MALPPHIGGDTGAVYRIVGRWDSPCVRGTRPLDGKPRTARRFTVYENCPLPTPEDRLLFILAYVKPYSLQVVQGRLFGMGQSKANQWIHVLLPALLAALRVPSVMPRHAP